MSTGETLYLLMVIGCALAFAATLSWVTYGPKFSKRTPARHPAQHLSAGAH